MHRIWFFFKGGVGFEGSLWRQTNDDKDKIKKIASMGENIKKM